MALKIIQHLQRFEWSLYCEPFAGSAAVYFRMIQDGIDQQIRDRKHHPRFVLNDADSRIVNLFRVCRDHATELALAAYFTPYSREEHRLAQLPQEGLSEVEEALSNLTKDWQGTREEGGNSWGINRRTIKSDAGGLATACTPQHFSDLPSRILTTAPHLGESQHETDALVEAARRYLVDGWQSFGRRHENTWGISKSTETRGTGKKGGNKTEPENFNGSIDRILSAVSVLKSCYIENDDAVKVIERWSCPHAAFFIDSPYPDCEKYYKEKWTLADHHRLAEALHKVEAKCVVATFYDHPLVHELYPDKYWEKHYFNNVVSSAGITRQSKTRTRPKRTEMILVRKQPA